MKLVEPETGLPALGALEGSGSGISSSSVPIAQSQVPGFSLLTVATKPSFRAEYARAAGRKIAVSIARWGYTRVKKGLWSIVATATVAAKHAREAA